MLDPGGLQAAIYLARFNRKVLLLHGGYGRTYHATHIENFLGHKAISGKELLEIGLEQAESFKVEIKNMNVKKVLKKEIFEVYARTEKFLGRYVIVASGILDVFPEIENIYEFLGDSFFTCITCDGYRTTNKKIAVIGNSDEGARLALVMKELYTDDITFILTEDNISKVYKEELKSEGIDIVIGNPKRIIGDKHMGAIELESEEKVECECAISQLGYTRSDDFLSELDLKRDDEGYIETNNFYESSLKEMYVIGPPNTGEDQAVIAAGQGAIAAININRNLI